MSKEIKGFEGLYTIDESGNVFSIRKKKYISPFYNKNGYMMISLVKDKKKSNMTIHRLLAEAFIDNKEKFPCINHIDGNKLNNNLSNLEWCTQSHNMKEAYKLGLLNTWCGKKFGKDHPNYKFRGKWKTQKEIVQLDKKGDLIKKFNSATEVERNLGYSCAHISECCRGLRKSAYGYIWKYVEKTFDFSTKAQEIGKSTLDIELCEI